MPAPTNTTTTEQMVDGLNREMVRNFDQENDRLMEILGIFNVEVMAANTTLFMRKVEGELTTVERAEGEEVPLSQYHLVDKPVGTFMPKFYRKATTAEAILKSGYVGACVNTDSKMLSNIRGERLNEFFGFMAKGTGAASSMTLQGVFAQADAVLAGFMEDHGDEAGRIFHFVNRFDIADYLENAAITTQTAYGMTYIKSFLGVDDIFVTNKVPKGKVYVTPVSNIHVFGTDIDELAEAGLVYEKSANGLIGVAHTPAYKNASAETHAISGMMLFAEIMDYIVVGTIGEAKALDDMTVDELKAYAARHSIDITGKTSKADILAVIKAAQ